MITGQLAPTQGSIHIYGHDNLTEWQKARRLVGLCPQQSILFPYLRVKEILLYYTQLKGTPREEVEEETYK